MSARSWAGILAICAFAAQTGATVNDVVSLVRSAIEEGKSDSEIAKALHRVKLAEKLDDDAVASLRSDGAGPKSTAELERLRKASAAFPNPAKAALQPTREPPAGEQQRVVEAARASALNYTRSLPDFICTEVVRRYDDSRRRQLDTLTLKLTYFDQREKYQLLTVNGRATALPYEAVGGVITQGEFGSLLAEVFDPTSSAEFHWDHWTTLRKRPAQVYSFRVPVERSHYRILVGSRVGKDEAVVGQHGWLFVDRDTSRTVRVVAMADNVPRDFVVLGAQTTLDYDFVEIGGRSFLLPLQADVRMRTALMQTRNIVEFHSYKKFGADTSITFTEKP